MPRIPRPRFDPSIDELLKDAWARVEPILRRNPAELARRLARRRKGILRNTPRAWCIAVRANDRRIHCWTSRLAPPRPIRWDTNHNRWRHEPHNVDLEYRNLVWLCRPQTIPSPGLTADEVAEMLGVNTCRVRYWMRRGWFKEVRKIPHLMGRRGPAVPVVLSDQCIDPQAFALGRMRHPLWGTQGSYVSDHLPPSFNQTILRIPYFGKGRFREHFLGWRWVCPVCGRRAKLLYYPLPCHLIASFVKPFELWNLTPEEQACRFACQKCNRVADHSRTPQAWNHVISHLSGGLLFGREVPRPASFVIPRRNRPYTHAHRAPSRRVPQIAQLLVTTNLTWAQIAQRLGVRHVNVSKVYRHYNVHRRHELRQLLLPSASPQAKAAG